MAWEERQDRWADEGSWQRQGRWAEEAEREPAWQRQGRWAEEAEHEPAWQRQGRWWDTAQEAGWQRQGRWGVWQDNAWNDAGNWGGWRGWEGAWRPDRWEEAWREEDTWRQDRRPPHVTLEMRHLGRVSRAGRSKLGMFLVVALPDLFCCEATAQPHLNGQEGPAAARPRRAPLKPLQGLLVRGLHRLPLQAAVGVLLPLFGDLLV